MGLYLKNIVFSLGTLYMHTLNNYYDEKYEELESLNGSYCTAIVVSEGEEKDYKDVYEIEIKGIKLLLNLKKSKNKSLQNKENRYLSNKNSKNSSFKLKYGDKIEFYLEYEKPSTARNYMGFDYSNYLKTKKIFGTVNLKEEDVEIISHDNSNIILRKIYKLRNLMKTKIEKLLPKETSGLCLGMLIGETSGIEENMQENFRDSNLSHILAVSGANVSYIIVSITYTLNLKVNSTERLSRI